MNNPSLLEMAVFPKKGKIQAYVEFPVSEDTAPYLVTSSKRVVWVSSPKKHACVVWAAVRTVSPEVLFQELILEILQRAKEEDWGSVFTPKQVNEACLRLCDYDLPETELLVSQDFPVAGLRIPAVLVPWLPAGHAVVVPVNRAFLGTIIDFGAGEVAALVHNAARGISILVP